MQASDTAAHPRSWYAASANPHPEHPALDAALDADACVVGGGYTGVSAALHLAERGYAVVLLEAGRVGGGASGRNGGQVGSGQRVGMRALERALGREWADALWALAEEAKATVRERVARHAIACDLRPGNLLACTRERFLPDLAAEAEHCARRYGYDGYRMLDRAEVRAAVASPRYCGGCLDAGGAHLHPLNFALGMAAAAVAAGVRVFERSRATRIEWGERPTVHTAAGRVRARFVVLCGNAYLGRVEPRIEAKVMPIVNHLAATAPLGAERAHALVPAGCCVHSTKHVVDYYRLSPDGRLVFGGGETYSDRPPPDLPGFVRRYLLRVFPQLADAPIEYAWSGRLAITASRLPHVGRLGASGFFAQGFSGHGVALAPMLGKLLAEAVAGSVERFDLFARLRHASFPGGALLRRPLLVLGMLYYALRDRL